MDDDDDGADNANMMLMLMLMLTVVTTPIPLIYPLALHSVPSLISFLCLSFPLQSYTSKQNPHPNTLDFPPPPTSQRMYLYLYQTIISQKNRHQNQ